MFEDKRLNPSQTAEQVFNGFIDSSPLQAGLENDDLIEAYHEQVGGFSLDGPTVTLRCLFNYI